MKVNNFEMTVAQATKAIEVWEQFVATRNLKILYRDITFIVPLYTAYGNVYNCDCKLKRAIAFLKGKAEIILKNAQTIEEIQTIEETPIIEEPPIIEEIEITPPENVSTIDELNKDGWDSPSFNNTSSPPKRKRTSSETV